MVFKFKFVNDKYGHLAGDEILRRIANGINKQIRATDIAARYGGDEFLIFLKNISSADFAAVKAGFLCELLQYAANFENKYINVTSSIGIAIYNGNKNFTDLTREADKALYIAKARGKNQYAFAETDNSYNKENEFEAATVSLNSLLEHMEAAVILYEVADNIRVIYKSPNCMKVLGRHSFELFEKNDSKSARAAESYLKILHESAADGESRQMAYKTASDNGELNFRYVRTAKVPYMVGEYPLVIAVVAEIADVMLEDISPIEMINSLPVGIAVVKFFDDNISLSFANDYFISLSGYSKEEFEKKYMFDNFLALNKYKKEIVINSLIKAYKNSLPVKFDYELENKKILKITVSYYRENESGREFFVVADL